MCTWSHTSTRTESCHTAGLSAPTHHRGFIRCFTYFFSSSLSHRKQQMDGEQGEEWREVEENRRFSFSCFLSFFKTKRFRAAICWPADAWSHMLRRRSRYSGGKHWGRLIISTFKENCVRSQRWARPSASGATQVQGGLKKKKKGFTAQFCFKISKLFWSNTTVVKCSCNNSTVCGKTTNWHS